MTDYNKIITTVNSITSDYEFVPDLNNCIVIDTSQNRIGINTITPDENIHVSGGTIKTEDLFVLSKLTTKNIEVQGNLTIEGTTTTQNTTSVNTISAETININGVFTHTKYNFDNNGNLTTDGNITIGDNLNVLNQTSVAEIRGPYMMVIDPRTHDNSSGIVRIKGDLQVDGSTTTIHSTELAIEDKDIILAKNAGNKNIASGAGIIIGKESDISISFLYQYDINSQEDYFESSVGLSSETITTNTLRATNIDLSLNALSSELENIDSSLNTLDDKINVITNVTPGIAVANKALVLDSSKNIGIIHDISIDGVFAHTKYSFDNSGNLITLGDISSNQITTNILRATNIELSLNALAETSNNHFHLINELSNSLVKTDLSLAILTNQITNSNNNNSNSGVGSNNGDGIINNAGQTYFELVTTQPNKFSFETNYDGIPTSGNASAITINWNYDDIIPKTNNVYNVINNIASVKQRQLPFINKIKFEISGTGLQDEKTEWIELSNIIIPDDLSYNQNEFKVYNFVKYTQNPTTHVNSILSKIQDFDIRIYGENYANNIPTIDNRALYFYNLSFKLAEPPSQPVFLSANYNNHNTIIADFSVVYIENNELQTQGKLKTAETSYNLVETLRSVMYNSLVHDDNIIETLNTNNTQFSVTLNNLFSGSIYNITTKVKNDLNDASFSISSETTTSEYTLLPNSRGIGTTINSNIAGNYKYITTSSNTTNLTNQNKIYINLGNNDTLTYVNSNNQVIELTKPYTINQKNETVGFGKFIDNSTSLINLKVSVNDILKQTLSFDGCFNTIPANDNFSNSNLFSFVKGGNIEDIYTDNKDKGFRLKSNITFYSIITANITNSIGDASTNPYRLKYEYIRDSNVGGSNSTNTYNIYVDNYSETPLISNNNNSGTVISVQYNMGIPSVDKFFLNMTRTYSSINSQYMYINGNNLISNIGSITNTSATSSKNLMLTNEEIVSDGIYSFTNTKMNNKTSNYYTNLHYTSNRLTKNNSISWNETIYNIYTSNLQILSLTINHYCDYNSFNKSSGSIDTAKLVLSNRIFWEIDNIDNLISNMGGLNFSQYTNHQNPIKDSTLLFIDGNFRTNASLNYPNVNDFSYNGVTISNFYSFGTTTYDLSGITDGNNGYKWIGFKFSMASDTSIHNFGGSQYNYLNIYQLLTASPINLSSNILFQLRLDGGDGEANNNQVIGFIQQQYSGSNRIGRLDRPFKSTELWYNQPSDESYYTIFQGQNRANYGSYYREDDNNWGPLLDINNGNDDIYIFIGMKNNVSLV